MSEYWAESVAQILCEEGINLTQEQATRVGKAFADCASVEVEYSGIAEQTRPGKPQKSPEQIRIARLEECIRRLSARYGVGINPDSMEISYLTPVGTSHMGTTQERI